MSNFNYGSSSSLEGSGETSESQVVNEISEYTETLESQEDYDDCGKETEETDETYRDSSSEVVSEETDDYEDCSYEEIENKAGLFETSDKIDEEDAEDYSDCRKEQEKPPKTAEIPEETEEVSEETTEIPEETEEVPEETAEIPEEAEEIPEETAEIPEETEEVPEETAEIPEETEESYEKVSAQKKETEKQVSILEARKTELEENAQEKFQSVLECERGTEEYKNALESYNETVAEKEETTAELDDKKLQHETLEKRTLELRQAQMEKGETAIAASEETLAAANYLQETYDAEYYSENPDIQKLESIQTENADIIKELSEERRSIKNAMDAKRDQISDYVSQNNMERYETENDPHYQEMIAEYTAMRENYRRIDYNAVKLDENNISIAELSGKPYESLREHKESPIREVQKGIDRPSETDYFVDEARTEKVLEPFAQQNWEKLSVEEQKEAMEQLADYNADILGIEDKPSIQFYYKEDSAEFGAFSEKANTIFVNEYNIGNSRESADTIAHEYRHCYQHMRAEMLENERDLEFKEGFDNYISPEDDYEGYKNQCIEQDACEYAKEFQDQIDIISQKNENVKESDIDLSDGEAIPFKTVNPEKGSVFDEAEEKVRIPDDVEKKQIEQESFKEVFEEKELQEIKDRVRVPYDNCEKIADHVKEFDNYKEHYMIEGGHIEKVHDKSLQAADALETMFSSNDYSGMYSADIDRKSLEMMALYHDTGMDGNIDALEYDTAKQEFHEKMILENPELSKQETEKLFEDSFRKNHSLQSAIHVLRDREFVESKGANADEVALGCLAHSKSNSGVTNLADSGEWETAITRIRAAVDEFNTSHPEEQIQFDESFIREEHGELSKEKLAQMRSETLCLRIGDANGHNYESHISQNGKEIQFDISKWKESTDTLPENLVKRIEFAQKEGLIQEVQNADVRIGEVRLTDENDRNGISRGFAVGEGNFKDLSFETDSRGGTVESITLVESDAYPLSTQFCIEERIKELNTASIEENLTVERYKGMSDKDYKEMVQNMKNSLPKVGITTVINLENASKLTEKSYEAFAAKMENQYGIHVDIRNNSTAKGKGIIA